MCFLSSYTFELLSVCSVIRDTEMNAVISLYVASTRGAMKKSFERMSSLTWRPRVSGLWLNAPSVQNASPNWRKRSVIVVFRERRGGLMASALNSGSSGPGSTCIARIFQRGWGSHCIEVRVLARLLCHWPCYFFSPELRTFCCALVQDTNLIVPPSTQVYKWVLANLKLEGSSPAMDQHPIQRRQ